MTLDLALEPQRIVGCVCVVLTLSLNVSVVGVDGYSSESDAIIIPSVLDFVTQDEMLTPLGRLDKYISSENVFNR